MATDASNVIQGPAVLDTKRSGEGTYTDVGFTQGGVALRHPRAYRDIEADQAIGVIAKRMTKEQMFVKTNLLEGTLRNLAIAWDQATPAATLGRNTSNVFEMGLRVVGPGVGVKTRTFTLSRCVSIGEGEFKWSKEEEAGMEVEFECIKEDGSTTYPTLGKLGTVADAP